MSTATGFAAVEPPNSTIDFFFPRDPRSGHGPNTANVKQEQVEAKIYVWSRGFVSFCPLRGSRPVKFSLTCLVTRAGVFGF